MPKRVSDVFQVDAVALKEHNVFNGFIEIDSKFYVDPRLLEKTSVYELKNSYKKVTNYFDDVLENVLKFIEYQNNFEAIVEKLIFSEIPLAGLGYSIGHTAGKGLGVKLAKSLCINVVEFVKLGIVDPMIFELSGLFEKNIGADRISDMVVHILLPELAQFSCRVAECLNFPKAPYSTFIGGQYFDGLPCYSNQGVLLVPEDILTSLPLAYSWTNADSITIHNEKLREYVNKMISKSWHHSPTWKEVVSNKAVFKELVFKKPELTKDLLDQYKAKSASPYDFSNDPKDEFKWHETARDYANRFPLNIRDPSGKFIENEKIVEIICKHFSKVVREGLCIEFYKDSGDPKSEKIGQLILLELIEHYLKESCFSVKYEHNHGFINLCNPNSSIESRLILKFTSTRRISEYYKELVELIQSNSALPHSTLVLIRLNRANSVMDRITAFDRTHRHEGTKFLTRFIIDGRIEIICGRKRPFR